MFSRNPFLWSASPPSPPLWLFSSFKLLIPRPEIYLPSKCLLSLYLTFIPRELRDSKGREFVSSTMLSSNVMIVGNTLELKLLRSQIILIVVSCIKIPPLRAIILIRNWNLKFCLTSQMDICNTRFFYNELFKLCI